MKVILAGPRRQPAAERRKPLVLHGCDRKVRAGSPAAQSRLEPLGLGPPRPPKSTIFGLVGDAWFLLPRCSVRPPRKLN